MSEIETLKQLVKPRKSIYSDSIKEKEHKQGFEDSLTRLYEPLLTGQTKQTKSIADKLETQIRNKLTSDTDADIVANEKHQELMKAIKDQPLIIPLIKSLNIYPEIIKVINDETDGSDLTAKEKTILKELMGVDDKILKTLIEYYAQPEQDITKYEEASESGVGTLGSAEKEPYEKPLDLIESQLKVSKDNKQYMMYGKAIYEYIVDPLSKKYTPDIYNKFLNNALNSNILNYNGKDINLKEKTGRTRKQILRDYLQHVDIKLSTKPWFTIQSYDPEFYEEIKSDKKSKSGKGITQFITSHSGELMKKLDVLMSEFKTGNNNVFNEIGAITDELRRQGVLEINQIKQIFRELKSN